MPHALNVPADKTSAIWTKTDTTRGHDAWELNVAGNMVAELERERATKWHGNGVGGLVVDMEAPAQWSVTLWDANDDHTSHRLASGLSVSAAKAAAVALLAKA